MTMIFSRSLTASSQLISLVFNAGIRTKVCLKRTLSTVMAASNEETAEQQDNVLSKRFVGLEKNIW
jgi:hypothetical protein